MRLISASLFIAAIAASTIALSYGKRDQSMTPDSPPLRMEEARIGIITDIQTERDSYEPYMLDPKLVVDPLRRFIEHENLSFRPRVIVHAGDFIEGSGRAGKKSIEDWKTISAFLAELEAPFLHVIGNHDRRGLTEEEWKALSGNNSTFYASDYGDLRIIVLDYDDYGKMGEVPTDGQERVAAEDAYQFSDQQLSWLEETLKQSSGFRTIVFLHVPINEPLIAGQMHKRVHPEEQRDRLRDLFSRYGVKAVISGHVEYLFYEEIGGVRYFILPGLYHSERKSVRWYGAYADAILTDTLSLRLYYRQEPEGAYRELAIPSPEFDRIMK